MNWEPLIISLRSNGVKNYNLQFSLVLNLKQRDSNFAANSFNILLSKPEPPWETKDFTNPKSPNLPHVEASKYHVSLIYPSLLSWF